jgi:UDP-glucose:tetrahydrobiopterin glucosyltransferase
MHRILFLSSPIGPVGSGQSGGVETKLALLTGKLLALGHKIGVVAPAESILPSGVDVYQIYGAKPLNVAVAARDTLPVQSTQGVLEKMWEKAQDLAGQYDVLIAMTHDWLSYYLTPFFPIPVLHWVTVSSTVDAVSEMIRTRYSVAPECFAFCSRAQVSTFGLVDPERARLIPGAVDTDVFRFQASADRALCWSARISPEKGLADALYVAERLAMPLNVCGRIQNEQYWESIVKSSPEGILRYHGFLTHERLRDVLGNSLAMLFTSTWTEAFGFSVIEALACGTPVVAYNSGGPAEIIEEGKSGYLVPPGAIDAMARAALSAENLSRSEARHRAEQFTILQMAQRVEEWIQEIAGRCRVAVHY